MKILLVDDSLVVRNALTRAVEALEASARGARSPSIDEVIRADNGATAVDLFALFRPELVTMDLTMPELDGLGAIRGIRSIEPETSILVISALNSHRTAMDALALGACGFLTKPFTEREVVDALRQLLEHASENRRASPTANVPEPAGGAR